MRHGPGSPPETVVATDLSAPAPALPRIDDTAAIARALEAVAVAVTRLEARLDQVLAAGRAAPATVAVPTRATDGPNRLDLEHELSTLLTEIARVRAQCEPATSKRPDADAHAHLGKLRRRQASILARLLQLDGDPNGDQMCFL